MINVKKVVLFILFFEYFGYNWQFPFDFPQKSTKWPLFPKFIKLSKIQSSKVDYCKIFHLKHFTFPKMLAYYKFSPAFVMVFDLIWLGIFIIFKFPFLW